MQGRLWVGTGGVRRIVFLTTEETVPDCAQGGTMLVGRLGGLEVELGVEAVDLKIVRGEQSRF